MSSAKGYLTIASALVLCPCHLPILAAVLAGTALGGAITENFGLLFPLTAVYFIGALFLGVRWLTRQETSDEMPACGPCEPRPVRSQDGEAASEPAGRHTDSRPPTAPPHSWTARSRLARSRA